MEGVDWVKLGHVQQVDADRTRLVDADRHVHICLTYSVTGIDLVPTIEVGVKSVHHHRHLLPFSILRTAEHAGGSRCRMFELQGGVRINDEQAIHALVHMPLQR